MDVHFIGTTFTTSEMEKQRPADRKLEGFFYDHGLRTLITGTLFYAGSVYWSSLDGQVVYADDSNMRSPFRVGYKHFAWDWTRFEFIPFDAFNNLDGYLNFIEKATYDQLVAFFQAKEILVKSNALFSIQCEVFFREMRNEKDETHKMARRIISEYWFRIPSFQLYQRMKAKLEHVGFTFDFDCFNKPRDLRVLPKNFES